MAEPMTAEAPEPNKVDIVPRQRSSSAAATERISRWSSPLSRPRRSCPPCCCSRCSRCSPRWCCRCSAARRRCGRWRCSSSRPRCWPATATRTCSSQGAPAHDRPRPSRAVPAGAGVLPIGCRRLGRAAAGRALPVAARPVRGRRRPAVRGGRRPTRRCCRRGSRATGHPHGQDPYFLYAATNLGSLIALLGYPFLLEPAFGLTLLSRLDGCFCTSVACDRDLLLFRSPRPTSSNSSGTGRERCRRASCR